MTEQQMLSGCLQGDREAQRELYLNTSDRIYRLLIKLTRNEADAADLLQDVYVRAFQHIDRFRGTSSLSTWIYRIAVNEAKQHFRRERRHDEIVRDEAPPPNEYQEGEQVAAAVRMDIWSAVSRLPAEERALIVLRYFEDMDYAHMAEVLEKPPGTIASGLNRARRMLEELLGEIPASAGGL